MNANEKFGSTLEQILFLHGVSLENLRFGSQSLVSGALEVVFGVDEILSAYLENVVHYSEIEIEDNLFVSKTFHLIKTEIFGEISLVVLLKILMKIRKDFLKLFEL